MARPPDPVPSKREQITNTLKTLPTNVHCCRVLKQSHEGFTGEGNSLHLLNSILHRSALKIIKKTFPTFSHTVVVFKMIKIKNIICVFLQLHLTMEELFPPGMFSHVTRRSVIPARNRRNPKQTNAFRTMQLLSVLKMLNDLGFISDYSNLAKNHRCVFCKRCLLPACQPAFVMGGADLGAQAGTYLVRFSTRTKIWSTNKTGE